MAKNFRVLTQEMRKQSLALRLLGDFDASSACELINRLEKNAGKNCKVVINTDGLRTIYPFGLDVFLPQMILMNNTRGDIEMTGKFSEVFLDERYAPEL